MTCNCKNTDELRIVRGNAFAIRLTVSAIHTDGTPVENFVLGDSEAVLKVMHLDEKTPKDFLIVGNDAIINFGGDMSLGWYGFEMTGTFNGKPWRWCVPQVFQVVETNAKANIPAWAVLTDETYSINGVMTITSGDIYQSDWDETDPHSPSFIKNKPDVVLHPEFNETVQRIDRDIDDEETRAKGAERDLETAIGNEERDRKAADVTLQQNIDAEALARGNADTTLQGNIYAEERDRKAADVTLQQNIDAEALARGNADTTLQGNIDAEEVRAKAAEKQNADDIDTIEGMIPQQASSQNQLADKNFVNSSVATNTAYYISDNGQPFTSLADLEAYSGPLTNNDYAFVVGTDQAGNTTYTRYKYNADTEQWAEEYVLNNSSFTAEQWAAISSGITSGDVAKLDALPTKAQLDLLLEGKQDTISDLQTIREGAAAGATAYQKPSGGIPKSDLAQSVQNSLSRADEAVVADGSGTSGQVLTSRGSGQEPGWQTGELVHSVTNVSGTAAVTTSGHYYSVKWMGQCESVTALRDGMMVNIKIPVQGNSTYHTVLNINGLGEHPVCRNVTNEASAYTEDSIITLIYDANAQAEAFFDSGTATTVTGVWKIGDYDSTNIYQLRHGDAYGTYVALTALPARVLCLQKNETTLIPVNATGETGTNKVLTTESFSPFGAIVYVSASYEANAAIASSKIYEQFNADFRISFNTGFSLTANKDVYICAVPQSDGMAKLDVTTPIVQELPSTDDGKIYIYLGHASSNRNVEIYPVHPVYWFKGGKVVPYTVLDISAKTDKVSGAVSGNFAGLDGNGNLTDSGKKASDFATAAQGAKADQAETDIDNIEKLIPQQATEQNQLADKQFVNSSISTATATYRGAYNEVSDLELTTAATEQQIAAALATKMAALSITPDNNDYCFVQIPTADATPTEIARVDRYKYDGTAWAFEFSLNNSGFTAAQWAALNSGITSGLVTKLRDLPTNAGLTTLLNGKQDTISDLQTIREGAAAGALAAPQATTYTKTEVDGLLLTKQAVITDGAQIGGGYGVCSTAASTVAKEVTIANFLLLKNVPVSVKFESAISVDSATLNINSTGAKPIFIQGAALQPGVVKAKDIVTLIYDGTNWNIVEILSVHVSPSDLYVDMGLPSGTLWAIANLDATTQSGFAEVDGKPSPFKYECTFFSWGNNVGHNPISDSAFDYDWGSSNSGPYASTPGATLTADAGLSFDAARAILGAPWRDPSTEDFAELFNNIDYVDANGDVISDTNKLVTINSIVGIRLKSKNNGNILFFPCSGYGLGQSWNYRGSYGFYWSRSLYSQTSGRNLDFSSGGVYPQNDYGRFLGFARRAVQ